jgi:hypothetical protein
MRQIDHLQEFPEDDILAPKHVELILILILHYLFVRVFGIIIKNSKFKYNLQDCHS